MNQNSVFRANARAQLGGNIFNQVWLMALVVCLVQSIVISLASSIVIGVILVGGLVSFGSCRLPGKWGSRLGRARGGSSRRARSAVS